MMVELQIRFRIRQSIEDGNDKNLIVLTRPEGYRKELSKSNKAAAKTLKRKYPHLPELLLNRHIDIIKQLDIVSS